MKEKTYQLSIIERKDGTVKVIQDIDRLNYFIITGILTKIRNNLFARIDKEMEKDIPNAEYIEI